MKSKAQQSCGPHTWSALQDFSTMYVSFFQVTGSKATPFLVGSVGIKDRAVISKPEQVKLDRPWPLLVFVK